MGRNGRGWESQAGGVDRSYDNGVPSRGDLVKTKAPELLGRAGAGVLLSGLSLVGQ